MNDSHQFCIAPMMECTDRHYRYLARLLTKHSMLYTEMITTGALLYGDRHRHLEINSCEHPIALQLGGSDPLEMARCTEYAAEFDYDEVNINVGCPSDRVQAGKFGARLMCEPKLVADCIKQMKQISEIDVTVKTRIGIDEQDSYEYLSNFINTIAEAGCTTIVVHARKAYLSGLSPKENRTIPPLRYERVHKLKQEYPQLNIILNGGLNDLIEIQHHLTKLDGVMVGRKAYEDPYFLVNIDAEIFNKKDTVSSRYDLLSQYLIYAQDQLDRGVPLHILMRPTLGLFKGMPGAKVWRRFLSENLHKLGSNINAIQQASSEIFNANNLSMVN